MHTATPYTVVDRKLLLQNIEEFASIAKANHKKLRPHIKTHKCPEIARLQMDAGACGITVATSLEAEAFFHAGFRDIFIACPQVSQGAIGRISALLTGGARLIVGFDHPDQLASLTQAALAGSKKLELRLEVDSGHHRCGLSSIEQIAELAKRVQDEPALELEGIYTHAGHVYGSKSLEQTRQIAHEEGEALVRVAKALSDVGICLKTLSAGSTPTHRWVAEVEGVTELRPGNYVFFDAMQVGLGIVPIERCSLRVVASVLSVYPDRFVIDAGSKALALDKGAHGLEGLRGHGVICGSRGWEISRLSEEHGIVEVEKGATYPKVGELIEIVPNHACAVANLAEKFLIAEGDGQQSWGLVGRR